MTDETKSPVNPPPAGETKPTAEKPAVPGGVKATPSGSVQADVKTPSEKAEAPAAPGASATPPKAASATPGAPAPPAKAATAAPPAVKPAAAPPKPPAPVPVPWNSPFVESLKVAYGSGIEALSYLGQNYLVAERSLIPEILQVLRDQHAFDYCVDLTAVHYPQREKQFELIWVLYSYASNERVRVKTQIAEGDSPPSSVPIWTTANWLEREVFDMFGIRFEGHPEMKRILLPEGWKGHPLRKDYGILQQDNDWVQINLGIESGQ